MNGWPRPPPREPVKSREQLRRERERKVDELAGRGLLRSEGVRRAVLSVPREDFIPRPYRDYAYEELPLPLPGQESTISCPHSYPLFYEPLGLDRGHRFLEVGAGSGYGAAVAREIVGDEGLVVTVDIDAETVAYARRNLERAGYPDVVVIHGDGAFGHPPHAPYDRVCLTAATPRVPPPLVAQMSTCGRLIAPLVGGDRQRLTLVTRRDGDTEMTTLEEVLYVRLRGPHGTDDG